MKSEVKDKLDKIADIWNHFIWKYQFCNRKIKFTEEVRTNYFGDILNYFYDTFDIVFNEKSQNTISNGLVKNISLLQVIYIHQDFIEELLIIFKCGVEKGDLKKNSNYSINRDLRNELIGHPIRRINGEFISSTNFGFNSEQDSIVYSRYHRDNNFQFEKITIKITEIINRHKFFLNTYFDKILDKLKAILNEFIGEIENLEKVVYQNNFETVIKLTSLNFESILESDFLYDKESLMKVYNCRKEHPRYQNIIDRFYKDLKDHLTDTKTYVYELLVPKKTGRKKLIEKTVFNVIIVSADTPNVQTETMKKVSYHYELEKLAKKRNLRDFEFLSSLLKAKCLGNETIMNELNHMESNISNDVEYYSSYRLICSELKEE